MAVIGCGGVGLSAINGAAIAGASQIFAIDMVESKLELARKFGATDVINAKNDDPVQAVRELPSGGVHYSFEAIGLAKTAQQSFKMLNFGGTATIIGMIPVGTQVELHGPEFLMERKMQGISEPTFNDHIESLKIHFFFSQHQCSSSSSSSSKFLVCFSVNEY